MSETYKRKWPKLSNEGALEMLKAYSPNVIGDWKDLFEIAIDAIEKSIKSRWIPCSERMPNDGEIVLLSFEGNKKIDMETAIYDVKYGFATADRYAELNEIIAWMPLPEPYKED